MQPSPDFDAVKVARSLLRRSRQGALATLMTGSGDPYCSLTKAQSPFMRRVAGLPAVSAI